MFKRPPGGIFRRDARWMLVLVGLVPLVGLVVAVVPPWIARSLR